MAPPRLRPRTPALETPPLRGLCVFPAPSWKWDCAASCWRSRWDCAGKPVSFYAGSREGVGGVSYWGSCSWVLGRGAEEG